MEKVLAAVRHFADSCHGSQTRKYSHDPYIFHPVRVMEMCKPYTDDVAVLAAALLHDVLEDTSATKHDLGTFLSKHMDVEQTKRTLKLVDELTDKFVKADYPQWNRKKRKTAEAARMEKTSPDAQTIKYADIIDNCRGMVQDDRDFAGTFLRECRSLLKKMNNGNKDLYEKAVQAVEKELAELKGKK